MAIMNHLSLTEIVDTIVNTVDPEQIILFGSRGRGEHRTDSDVDLLIVERYPFHSGRSRWEEMKRVRRALSKFHVAKDILVYSKDEMDKWRHSTNHIIATSLHEGKIVYERS